MAEFRPDNCHLTVAPFGAPERFEKIDQGFDERCFRYFPARV